MLLVFCILCGLITAATSESWCRRLDSSYQKLGNNLSPDIAVEGCLSYCKDTANPRTTFFGVRHSGLDVDCYCGDRIPAPGDSTCDRKCGDGDNLVCGGSDVMTIQTVCQDGTYGSLCNRDCSVGCGHNICDRNDGDCTFTCKTGYYGLRCTPCPDNCQNGCLGDGNCNGACNTGYYGNKCDMECPQNCQGACNKDNGECNTCKAGYYGDKCTDSCPEKYDGSCNKEDGGCNACVVGYYDDMCDKICSATCKNDECGQQTAQCIKGCNDGYYGITCDQSCSPQCNAMCQQYGGSCDGCLVGSYGDMCNKTCSAGCKDGTCNQNTARCNAGCIDGWYGDMRDSQCPPNCVNIRCSRQDGACIGACNDGWYGESYCNLTCPEGCNGPCDIIDGACIGYCKPGFYGMMCDQSCSEYEKFYNKIAETCDQPPPTSSMMYITVSSDLSPEPIYKTTLLTWAFVVIAVVGVVTTVCILVMVLLVVRRKQCPCMLSSTKHTDDASVTSDLKECRSDNSEKHDISRSLESMDLQNTPSIQYEIVTDLVPAIKVEKVEEPEVFLEPEYQPIHTYGNVNRHQLAPGGEYESLAK